MRRLGTALGIVLLVANCAYGATAVSQFFVGQDNLASDNDCAYLIDLADPLVRGPTFVDQGDIILGSMSFNTVEDLSGGGGTRALGTGGVDELSALFALKVLNVANPWGVGVISVGPVTPAETAAALANGQMSLGLKQELDLWAPGTLLNVYNDPAQDYTRTFNAAYPGVGVFPPGADDGDTVPPSGTDIGIPSGMFVGEEQLLASVYNWMAPGPATQVYELGFTGPDTDGDSAPNAALGEGWDISGSDNMAVLRATPPPTPAATESFGLNVVVNNTGLTYSQVPTDPAFGPGGTADIAGSALLFGIGNANTPYDTFSNTDLVFHPVPEPSTALLLGMGVIGFGACCFRRRSCRRRSAV